MSHGPMGFGFGRNLLSAGERLLHSQPAGNLNTVSGTVDGGNELLRSSTSQFGRATSKLKSQRDLAAMAHAKDWPTQSSAYQLLEDCGRGVSATVHKALCLPLNEIVAVKKMNLESMNCDLDEIYQEAHTMKQYNHPNVLPLYCSFVDNQDLWMVMPFIAGGSVLHIMKYGYPEGLDEVVIATIMRDVLKALDYVHKNGAIHRDIKAGNILIDKDGAVKLADFGVAAKLERGGDWGHDKQSRMTFVGTPCWMAPEVMEQTQGYGSSADIWSCGITILEMAHGHAPFAKYPPMKVLLMTLQNPPPTLDDKGKKHFSKLIKDVVTRCLQKDPSLRPTAAQLLEHKFFKQAKDDEYLVKHLVSGLPSLGERVQAIRQGKAATTAQDNDVDFARSQEEYKKGVSSWNFDVVALKAQAALELDENALPSISETEEREDPLMASGRLPSSALPAPAVVVAPAGVPPPPGAAAGPPTPPAFAGPAGSPPAVAQQQMPPPAGPPTPRPAQAHQDTGNVIETDRPSAFATLHGQAQANGSISARGPLLPVAPVAVDAGAAPQPPLASQPAHTKLSPTMGSVEVVSPLSPGVTSPPGLSREGSMTGPMSQLVTTPTGAKKEKKQGRFQVYEDGEVPPPLSPGPLEQTASFRESVRESVATASYIAANSSRDGAARFSDDGRVQEGEDASGIATEPKKRGRFKIIEEANDLNVRHGLSKASSSVNLAEGHSGSGSGKTQRELLAVGSGSMKGELLGRPPPAPSAPVPPMTAVLPKLQELLDHQAQQTSALHRLMAAVHDVERGRTPTLFSRSAGRTLFERSPAEPSLHVAASFAEGDHHYQELKHRSMMLEEENTRLRLRNHQLESMLGLHPGSGSGTRELHAFAQGSGSEGGSSVSAPFSSRPPSQVHMLAPVTVDGALAVGQQQQGTGGSGGGAAGSNLASPLLSPRAGLCLRSPGADRVHHPTPF